MPRYSSKHGAYDFCCRLFSCRNLTGFCIGPKKRYTFTSWTERKKLCSFSSVIYRKHCHTFLLLPTRLRQFMIACCLLSTFISRPTSRSSLLHRELDITSLNLISLVFVNCCCFHSYRRCWFHMSCTGFILLVTLTIDSLTDSTEGTRLSSSNINVCDWPHSCSTVLHFIFESSIFELYVSILSWTCPITFFVFKVNVLQETSSLKFCIQIHSLFFHSLATLIFAVTFCISLS